MEWIPQGQNLADYYQTNHFRPLFKASRGFLRVLIGVCTSSTVVVVVNVYIEIMVKSVTKR